jgi:hypothetical protein
MDLKSFVAGTLCGALLWAGGSALFGRVPDVALHSDRESPIPNSSAVQPQPPPGENQQAQLPQQPKTIPRNADQTSLAQSNSAPPETESAPASVRTTPEEQWFDNYRYRLNKEPRDDSWAYFTEHAIELFLSNHRDMSDFALKFIECRSNSCQIGVEGYDKVTGPTWDRVMYDMRQQAWFDFTQAGTTSSTINGHYMILADLKKNVVNQP